MGFIEIPDMPPPGGGRMSATLVLERHEMMETIDLLKAALAEYTQSMANGQLANLALGRSPSQAAPAGPSATSLPAPVPAVPVPAPQPSVARPGAVPVMPPQPVQQQQQPFLQQYQPQPQARPQQPQPQVQPLQQQMAQIHLQQPQPQVMQQRPPSIQQPQPLLQQQQQPAHIPVPVAQPQPYTAATAAVPAPRPAVVAATSSDGWSSATAVPAPAAAAAAPSTRWQMVFTSDPEDHAKTAVSAMAYAQTLPGLPSGDGHAGWLVSASKGVLNLWETNRAVADEMALLCMHQQAVDVNISKLVLEPATKLCLGAALGSGNAAECISVNSLDPESLLASRYKFAPPANRGQAAQRLMQQVESLHGMTPGLKNHIMASYGERLLVFQTKSETVPEKDRSNASKYTRTGSVLHDPEFHFVAHPGSVITALHRSPLEGSCTLVTGAADGKIHMWDLKAPPKQPNAQMNRHTKNVTGLSLVSDDRLASSSMDGTVLLWDLRSPGSPLYRASAPRGAAVLKIAAGPWGDVLAVSTAKGLHCLELFDFEAPMANIAAYPLQRPFTEIMFNTKTHDLYAGCSNGAIQVFSRHA